MSFIVSDRARRDFAVAGEFEIESTGLTERRLQEADHVCVQSENMSVDGMWPETCMATSARKVDINRNHTGEIIRADEEYNRWFAVEVPEGTYSAPHSEIEMAIEATKQGVHSKGYYDKLSEEEGD